MYIIFKIFNIVIWSDMVVHNHTSSNLTTKIASLPIDMIIKRALQASTPMYCIGPFHEGLSQRSRQFYGPKTRGRYLDEPVPMAVSR